MGRSIRTTLGYGVDLDSETLVQGSGWGDDPFLEATAEYFNMEIPEDPPESPSSEDYPSYGEYEKAQKAWRDSRGFKHWRDEVRKIREKREEYFDIEVEYYGGADWSRVALLYGPTVQSADLMTRFDTEFMRRLAYDVDYLEANDQLMDFLELINREPATHQFGWLLLGSYR